MNTKTQADDCIKEAAAACEKALAQWQMAATALNGTISVNGFGIINDRYAFRQKLIEAQARIAASFAALDDVQVWPSNADYDQL